VGNYGGGGVASQIVENKLVKGPKAMENKNKEHVETKAKKLDKKGRGKKNPKRK